MRIRVTGPALSVSTCAGRLEALLPARVSAGSPHALARAGDSDRLAEVLLELEVPWAGEQELDCRITWHGPEVAGDLPGSEAMIQATCGLAHLHGLDAGGPRRLGVEVASVAAGLLASQGTLAALIGTSRGRSVPTVRTSVTQAALLSISQYIARGTSSEEWSEWMPVPGGPDPGPPFASADGELFEIETLDAEAWKIFWLDLGVDPSLLGRAWTLFNARFSTARCSMPEGFHAATRRRPLSELAELARRCEMSLCRVRSAHEVMLEPGVDKMELPEITSVAGDGATAAGGAQSRPSGPSTLELAPSPPLAGLRVVEATSRVQGPLGGQLLRMLGAEVERVEPPGGDPGRFNAPLAGETGAFFLCVNRGKQPVELDLAQPVGRDALLDLAGDADAFLHNWRPGKAEQWGLDASALARRNPGLVYCAASGWGRMAARCPPIGMEFLVQAYAGLGSTLNPAGQRPLPTRLLLTDFMGAMVACEGLLAGLWLQARTGTGPEVATSLLAGAMTLQHHILREQASGRERGRRDGRPLWGPLDVPLPTAEGHVMLSAGNDERLRHVAETCGVNQAAGRELRAAIARRLAARPGEEWERLLLDAGIPCGLVCTDVKELARRPRLDGCLESLPGTTWAPSAPWRFSADGR